MISKDLQDILNTLPQHLNKGNTTKFLSCFNPILEYLDSILDEDIGMSNIDKAHNEYLDYIGYKLLAPRNSMTDEEYKPFLKMMRFKSLNAPTTQNMLELAYNMSGYYPSETYFYPNGEPASQYIKFVVPYTADLSKIPDFNEICDAGARIYRDIVSKAERKRYNPIWIAGKTQLNMNIEKFEVPTGGGM